MVTAAQHYLIWYYLIPLNDALKNVKLINFKLHVFYQNKKIWINKWRQRCCCTVPLAHTSFHSKTAGLELTNDSKITGLLEMNGELAVHCSWDGYEYSYACETLLAMYVGGCHQEKHLCEMPIWLLVLQIMLNISFSNLRQPTNINQWTIKSFYWI